MEFRCRLASPSGEIVEGVYVAETVARLRHELEEKGLYVLALQPKGSVGGLSVRLPRRTTVPSAEFLIFNQELATLLKAGMPLVQSLDLLRQRCFHRADRTSFADLDQRVPRLPRVGRPRAALRLLRASTFQQLFRALVNPDVTVRETECEAMGAEACLFEVRW